MQFVSIARQVEVYRMMLKLSCRPLAFTWPEKQKKQTKFPDMMSCQIFWRCFDSLVKFSFWSKFHVNVITGSEVIKFFFYKWLIKNPEIGYTPVWVLPNIWRLGQVRDTESGKDVSNKMLLNAAKCQGYSFYHFWVIKEKPTGGG